MSRFFIEIYPINRTCTDKLWTQIEDRPETKTLELEALVSGDQGGVRISSPWCEQELSFLKYHLPDMKAQQSWDNYTRWRLAVGGLPPTDLFVLIGAPTEIDKNSDLFDLIPAIHGSEAKTKAKVLLLCPQSSLDAAQKDEFRQALQILEQHQQEMNFFACTFPENLEDWIEGLSALTKDNLPESFFGSTSDEKPRGKKPKSNFTETESVSKQPNSSSSSSGSRRRGCIIL